MGPEIPLFKVSLSGKGVGAERKTEGLGSMRALLGSR